MLGGTGGFDVQNEDPDNIVTINLAPNLGFFVIDNLAIGGLLDINSVKVGDNKSNVFGIAPFGRYYFGASNIKAFLHAQVGYISSKYDFGIGDETISGAQFGGGPGLAFFLNDHVAIEGLLAYEKWGGDFDTSHVGLTVGVQAYLGGK